MVKFSHFSKPQQLKIEKAELSPTPEKQNGDQLLSKLIPVSKFIGRSQGKYQIFCASDRLVAVSHC
jgi:hypothetical protein